MFIFQFSSVQIHVCVCVFVPYEIELCNFLSVLVCSLARLLALCHRLKSEIQRKIFFIPSNVCKANFFLKYFAVAR